ncbi:MAG: four helix bundle protein [Goleter apudmare HA4340-LM2]|jgi:four helix bundle protein|nr:four helix bundle protein [Goleter apudmare HA4340-LM2]
MSNHQAITDRTFEFAIRIINLCKVLEENAGVGRTISKQLLKSGTSIGANVEESQSAQSTADFVHKLEIALKEGRETRYWLRILIAADLLPEQRLVPILGEINELIKIIAAIIVKTKQNRQQ